MDISDYMNQQSMNDFIKKSYSADVPNTLNPRFMPMKLGGTILERPEAYFPKYQSLSDKLREEIDKRNEVGVNPEYDPYFRNLRDVNDFVHRQGRFATWDTAEGANSVNLAAKAKEIINSIPADATPSVIRDFLKAQFMRVDELSSPQDKENQGKVLKLVTAM